MSERPPARGPSPERPPPEGPPAVAGLPPAAQRALAEAAERRRKARPLELQPEVEGRNGPEPVRYGDYEKDGRAIDF